MGDEKGRGGRRAGSGRKKGAVGPSLHDSLTISLPAPLWTFLTETAKNEYGLHRSRYIDRLVAAVLRDGVSFELNFETMSESEKAGFQRLSAGPLRTGFISMLKETWAAFDKIMLEKQCHRSKLMQNIILSQVIKPIERRVKLDMVEFGKEAANTQEGFVSKAELVARVFDKGAFPSKLEIGKVFDVLCDCIHDAIIAGENINLPDVGRLTVKKRAARSCALYRLAMSSMYIVDSAGYSASFLARWIIGDLRTNGAHQLHNKKGSDFYGSFLD